MAKPTRREMILALLEKHTNKLSCQEICKTIIKKQNLTGNVAHYLSGSVSSILNKLVKDGELKYADGTAVRGGHLYQRVWHPIDISYKVTCDTLEEFDLFTDFAAAMKKLKEK